MCSVHALRTYIHIQVICVRGEKCVAGEKSKNGICCVPALAAAEEKERKRGDIERDTELAHPRCIPYLSFAIPSDALFLGAKDGGALVGPIITRHSRPLHLPILYYVLY
jgi:hypothetical protein